MYLSDAGKHWLAGLIAAEDWTVSLHTGAPGDAGADNELAAAGGSNYARKLVAAAGWGSDAGSDTADNEAEIEVFVPNAAAAGQPVSHIGYWRGAEFFASAELADPVRTVEGQPFPIATGTAAFRFVLSAG